MANTFFYREACKDNSQITWKDIFSESFKKHTKAEIEYAFTAGSRINAATPQTMLKQWQKPWLWLRVFCGGIAVCAMLYLAFLLPGTLGGEAPYPALMLILFIVPPFVASLTVMTLLWELNIPRNVSIYSMLGYFLIGGAFSIAFTQLVAIAGMPCGGAPLAPLTEEPGKCLAVAAFLVLYMRSGRKVYGLTGLLIGAGVGAGFTTFESIQYNFIYTASAGDAMLLAFRRSIPLFGGHILFCAPYAAGLALGLSSSRWTQALTGKAFLIPFAVSCLGHFLWNANASYTGSVLLEWAIAASLWLSLLYMVRKCLTQAVREGRAFGPQYGNADRAGEEMQSACGAPAVLMLYCLKGPLQGQSWRFDGGRISLGREAGNTICLTANAPGVSRSHCCLQKTAGGWIITDLRSSCGTYLSGKKLMPGVASPLHTGEIFYLGSTEQAFRVQIG